ncbi:hypothetical protein PMIT1323_02533 [Prochlorococcus marinus str. MIT 1323]|nr:hypothetical protein PMIT1323_02533 [Prochlorococcus marinus str. MIT 1323]
MKAKSLMTLFWLLLFYFTERLPALEEAQLSYLENVPRVGQAFHARQNLILKETPL